MDKFSWPVFAGAEPSSSGRQGRQSAVTRMPQPTIAPIDDFEQLLGRLRPVWCADEEGYGSVGRVAFDRVADSGR